MARGLAVSGADVQTPAGTHKGVAVLVRRGTAKITKGREVLADVAGVAGVATTGKRTFTVTFNDGDVWQVERQPCLPCSGRR